MVFGDIGTSPLYALRECFGPHGVPLNLNNILGILSLILWSTLIVVTMKYLLFVMRADNRGEGGILALMALVMPANVSPTVHRLSPVLILGLFGAALLYGDGIITPAISVLSAVEGLEIALPVFKQFVVPTTALILIGLFSVQKYGTAHVGRIFGPVMTLWFFVLALLGITNAVKQPEVFSALNPYYAVRFFVENGFAGFAVLGSVFLVVTGGEALYADMGHFGRRPIKLGWFVVALPALALQYFGQAALLIRSPEAISNPFYLLAPAWALYPLVALATAATVIASQAMLTGAFSMSHQAIQLGFLPHVAVKYTSKDEKGQIYVSIVNWLMLIGTLILVFEFQSSSRLAAAYGIAVTGTMMITTALTFVVARSLWKWNLWLAGSVAGFFLFFDLAFFGANALKILHGGWLPLALGGMIFFLMVTWKRGRSLVAANLAKHVMPIEVCLKEIVPLVTHRVKGNAVFMTEFNQGTPPALLRNVKHNQVLHETVVFLSVIIEEIPYVTLENRVSIQLLSPSFYQVIARFGFMESPDIPRVLEQCAKQGLTLKIEETTFYMGRRNVVATNIPGMAEWRESIFVFLARNSETASSYFQIPASRVIELGMVVEI